MSDAGWDERVKRAAEAVAELPRIQTANEAFAVAALDAAGVRELLAENERLTRELTHAEATLRFMFAPAESEIQAKYPDGHVKLVQSWESFIQEVKTTEENLAAAEAERDAARAGEAAMRQAAQLLSDRFPPSLRYDDDPGKWHFNDECIAAVEKARSLLAAPFPGASLLADAVRLRAALEGALDLVDEYAEMAGRLPEYEKRYREARIALKEGKV